MKRTTRYLLLIAILLISTAASAQFYNAQTLSGMERIARSASLDLYFSEDTTEIAVVERDSGRVWHSNPPNRQNDPIANELNLARLSSQVEVEIYTPRDQRLIFNSFANSVEKGTYLVEAIQDGVRVTYTLNNYERGEADIPIAVAKDRFEERFLGQMTEEERELFLQRYTFDEDEGVYFRRGLPVFVVDRFLEILDRIGYTPAELRQDRGVSERYTQAEQEEVQERVPGVRFGVTGQRDELEVTVPVEYRLEDDTFVASVDSSRIVRDQNYPVHSVTLLRYFGAAGPEAEGYMLVPDGSGALIYLNNGKSNRLPYSAAVYGEQEMEIQRERLAYTQPIYLPVYGIKNGDAATLAMIEEGDAIAGIRADVSGRLHTYNSVGPTFRVMERGRVTIGTGNQSRSKLIFQDTVYDGRIQVRYSFLSGSDATYYGMARAYADHLKRRGYLQGTVDGDRALHLQLIGAVDVDTTFAGISFRTIKQLTTFPEVTLIADALLSRGVDNLRVRYTGFLENGLHHTFAGRPQLERRLGRRREFSDLVQSLDERGVHFAPDASIVNVYTSGNGFNSRTDAERYLNQAVARSYAYDLATLQRDLSASVGYYLSPGLLDESVTSVTEFLSRYGITSAAFGDLGREVRADNDEDEFYDRQDARELVEAAVRVAGDRLEEVVVDGANLPALTAGTTFHNVPFTSSQFNIIDEDVPFVQLVLRGNARFTGAPLNLSATYQADFMKSLETGADLLFTWTHADASVLKNTEFDELYSTEYTTWLDRAADLITEAQLVGAAVGDSPITSRQEIDRQVYRTEYENGVVLISNYNRYSVEVSNQTVSGMNYLLLAGESGL